MESTSFINTDQIFTELDIFNSKLTTSTFSKLHTLIHNTVERHILPLRRRKVFFKEFGIGNIFRYNFLKNIHIKARLERFDMNIIIIIMIIII